jgi:hypothetical protein
MKYFKEMLNRYRDGEEISQDDDVILFELLQRHPEADEKIGEGVKCFYRSKSIIHPTSCFHIVRTDGTCTDFSYVSCISGRSSTLPQQFYEACRYAVSENLINDKKRLFGEAGGTMRCTKTGDVITINESDYRHTTPKFREIVRNFIAVHKITISPEMISCGSDLQYVVKFKDSKIENLFKCYHKSISELAMFKKNIGR